MSWSIRKPFAEYEQCFSCGEGDYLVVSDGIQASLHPQLFTFLSGILSFERRSCFADSGKQNLCRKSWFEKSHSESLGQWERPWAFAIAIVSEDVVEYPARDLTMDQASLANMMRVKRKHGNEHISTSFSVVLLMDIEDGWCSEPSTEPVIDGWHLVKTNFLSELGPPVGFEHVASASWKFILEVVWLGDGSYWKWGSCLPSLPLCLNIAACGI